MILIMLGFLVDSEQCLPQPLALFLCSFLLPALLGRGVWTLCSLWYPKKIGREEKRGDESAVPVIG